MRPNNFDIVRLLAALQVVYCHTTHHLHITSGVGHPALSQVINWFPGVPIFFTVSGFLISRSWEGSTSWINYAQNRALRIYPALWAAFGAAIVLAASFGFVTMDTIATRSFAAWIVAQLTFVQFYNPEFLRGFGLGAINGSLWTIPVELGFYITLPVLYTAILNRTSRRIGNVALGLLALLSFTYWFQLSELSETGNFLAKLQLMTPLPHLYMFLFGVLLQRNFSAIRPYVEGRLIAWLGLYSVYMLVAPSFTTDLAKNIVLLPFARLLLGLTTISAAFTYRSLGERLLRGNDFSYGVYLYHGLVLNALFHLGYRGDQVYLAITTFASLAFAALSWRFVEQPALSLKRFNLAKPIPQSATSAREDFRPLKEAA